MAPRTLAARLAEGRTLSELPSVVDVRAAVPANPPESVQVQFVGASYERAYTEAEAFVAAVTRTLAEVGHPGLAAGRVLDFGAGWGRISRVLLADVPPRNLFAADVDSDMIALVATTLPGVNTLTVAPSPPTVLAGSSMDAVTAFSVFSHLSGPAHRAWAREIGRLVRPGGVVAITVLGEDFVDMVAGSQAAVAAGVADDFARSMAAVFDDVDAVRAGFHDDQVQFGATGGGGVRTDDYYGWAVASRRCVERLWGEAGLEVVRWWPSGTLCPQAVAVLVRPGGRRAARWVRGARRRLRHRLARGRSRAARRLSRSFRRRRPPRGGRRLS